VIAGYPIRLFNQGQTLTRPAQILRSNGLCPCRSSSLWIGRTFSKRGARDRGNCLQCKTQEGAEASRVEKCLTQPSGASIIMLPYAIRYPEFEV
jgi:hypothetical protein